MGHVLVGTYLAPISEDGRVQLPDVFAAKLREQSSEMILWIEDGPCISLRPAQAGEVTVPFGNDGVLTLPSVLCEEAELLMGSVVEIHGNLHSVEIWSPLAWWRLVRRSGSP